MVETMCRETMGPSACKLTMRPVVQWVTALCRERRWVRVDYFARDCKTTVRRVQLLRRCVVKQCIFLGLFSVVASELTSTVICAEGSVVGTMCLETMIPCACKLTMRLVAQVTYSFMSRVTTRFD
jgi:hypothetical protein